MSVFQTRKKRLQFSMAGVLAVVAAGALFSLWSAKYSQRSRKQQAAVKSIEQSEGTIVDYQTTIPAPAWLRKVVGEEYFRSAKTVEFATNHGRRSGTDEPKATDATLVYLENLTDVETLELGNCHEVTDEGLVHLGRLKNLTTLYLYESGVRGPGLRHIAELPKLSSISLSRAQVEDVGLKHLGKMQQLTWLQLDNSNITDVGLSDLVSATQLQSLALQNTNVSDAGLRHLESLEHLESLSLLGTKVSAKGVARFKRLRPSCNVYATFGLGEEASETLLFDEGYAPTAEEINARLRELGIDGEVATDGTQPGKPIVSLRLFSTMLSDKVVLQLVNQMPKLAMLNLRRGMVGDELLRGLEGKPIRYLSLQETRISDEGLPHLSGLSSLNTLILDGTNITDDGLAHLQALTGLTSVSLVDSRASRHGIERLKEALPNW